MRNVAKEIGIEARIWNGGCVSEGGGSGSDGEWFEANEAMEF